MKIWIGGYGSCGVHNEYHGLKNMLTDLACTFTKDLSEADIIILLDTCIGSYKNINKGLDAIDKVHNNKKENATVILSGCMAEGVNFDLNGHQKEILSKVIIVKRDDLVHYILNLLGVSSTKEECEYLPITFDPHQVKVSPVSGCLNNCSFCKKQYMNFGLKSHPLEQIEELKKDIVDRNLPVYMMAIHSSNLSLYGVDIFNEPKAHEVIKKLTSPEQIKFTYTGALINIYEELVLEIINNPKIKHINISLESGSPRIYKLMNRPLSLKQVIEIIKRIKKERPDIVIHTELIAGFPTENEDDIKMTIDLIHELDIAPDYIFPYQNSPYIASSLLPQSSIEHREQVRKELVNALKELKDKFENSIINGEYVALRQLDTKEKMMYVMDTLGHIRVVRTGDNLRSYEEGQIIPAGTIKEKQFVLFPKK